MGNSGSVTILRLYFQNLLYSKPTCYLAFLLDACSDNTFGEHKHLFYNKLSWHLLFDDAMFNCKVSRVG